MQKQKATTGYKACQEMHKELLSNPSTSFSKYFTTLRQQCFKHKYKSKKSAFEKAARMTSRSTSGGNHLQHGGYLGHQDPQNIALQRHHVHCSSAFELQRPHPKENLHTITRSPQLSTSIIPNQSYSSLTVEE
eukprot:7323582-Pyramimonas_sp.AAC.1